VPRYGRSVVAVPLRQGRPLWIDDPNLALSYHVRDVALAGSADEAALARFAGGLLSQPLDHDKPLWELWLVERLAGERFALVAKTHHALVDGEDNRDLVSVLLDSEPGAPRPESASAWLPPPRPGPAQLLLEALTERASDPREAVATVRALGARTREELEWRDLDPLARTGAPPRSRLNVPIGPDRRFTWIEIGLGRLRKAKERLGGTVNDAVLTAVAGAVGRYSASTARIPTASSCARSCRSPTRRAVASSRSTCHCRSGSTTRGDDTPRSVARSMACAPPDARSPRRR
jgi:diacylglycerol O-acyltransferase / wax synthase